jgi:hypothetical protein
MGWNEMIEIIGGVCDTLHFVLRVREFGLIYRECEDHDH